MCNFHFPPVFPLLKLPTKPTNHPPKDPTHPGLPPWCNADSTHSTSQNRNRELLGIRGGGNCWEGLKFPSNSSTTYWGEGGLKITSQQSFLPQVFFLENLRCLYIQKVVGAGLGDFRSIDSRSWMIESQMSSNQNLGHSIIILVWFTGILMIKCLNILIYIIPAYNWVVQSLSYRKNNPAFWLTAPM